MKPEPGRKPFADSHCTVLLVDGDSEATARITKWLQYQHVRVVRARSSAEAMEMLNDVLFIEARFDGVLAAHHLPDAFGTRLIQEVQEAMPDVSAGLLVNESGDLMNKWARSRRVALLRKPLADKDLQTWLNGLKIPA